MSKAKKSKIKQLALNLGVMLCSLMISIGIFILVGNIYIKFKQKSSLSKPSIQDYQKLPYYAKGKNGKYTENEKETWYTFGNLVTYNKLNFREKDFDIPKPNGVFRIMVLGDSFTWGTGLPVEKRYSNILETLLREALIIKEREVNVEVLTFSRGGGHMGRTREYLYRYHTDVDPDLIVIGMCYNDPNPLGWVNEGTRTRYENKIISKITAYLVKHHYFHSKFLKSKLTPKGIVSILLRFNIIPDPFEANYISGYDKDGKLWKNFISDLEKIQKLSQEITGRPPIIVFLMPPGSTQGLSYYKPPGKSEALAIKMFAQVKPYAENMGFLTVDVLPAFQKELNGKYLALNLGDAHPNELCHQIYANEIKKVILGEIFSYAK